jgi:hypothetical protein
LRKELTVGARNGNEKSVSYQPPLAGLSQPSGPNSVPQQSITHGASTTPGPLAGLNETDKLVTEFLAFVEEKKKSSLHEDKEWVDGLKLSPEERKRRQDAPTKFPEFWEGTGKLNLTENEWDTLFCLAIKDHFEREQVWVPSVLRTMALLEGINDKTGRPCRIYVLPNRRIVMVETLS